MERLARLTPLQFRRRYALRRVAAALTLAAVVAALALADHWGAFGRRTPEDMARYDGKSFRVVHVVDGDTLDVDVPDDRARFSRTRIRLWGVDTPETVKPNTPPQHFGREASARAHQLADGLTVRLDLERRRTRDKYDRLLAYVTLPDGRMLNRVLVEEGFGYADPRFEHRLSRDFERAQRQAIADRRGLWVGAAEADLPPYLRGRVKLPAPASRALETSR